MLNKEQLTELELELDGLDGAVPHVGQREAKRAIEIACKFGIHITALQKENKRLQAEVEQLKEFKQDATIALEWMLDEGSEIFEEPCKWSNPDDDRCMGHMEHDVNAWVCGNEGSCPLNML